MNLKLYSEEFKVVRLKKALSKKIEGLFFYSQTEDEFSLVCNSSIELEHIDRVEYNYRLLKIEGILDFSLVGIISKISGLLAKQKISIFVVSTYNTDYFMVKNNKLQETVELLESNGYIIEKQ
ncbi:MAG: ACT domain-containing protein [Tenericutes bacterium]|nr:ACT domain-containing protein [Mycoplasmatota bacterium]